MLDSQGCKVTSCEQWRYWSDYTNALADLSLRCAYMREGTFFSRWDSYKCVEEIMKICLNQNKYAWMHFYIKFIDPHQGKLVNYLIGAKTSGYSSFARKSPRLNDGPFFNHFRRSAPGYCWLWLGSSWSNVVFWLQIVIGPSTVESQ